MCLNSKWDNGKKTNWLKKRPKTITAYKLVDKEDGEYVSFHFPYTYYESKKMNRVKGTPEPITLSYAALIPVNQYVPYYHLYLFKKGAKYLRSRWTGYNQNSCIVECQIPKKDITTIGEENAGTVIVTKAFKIVKEVK